MIAWESLAFQIIIVLAFIAVIFLALRPGVVRLNIKFSVKMNRRQITIITVMISIFIGTILGGIVWVNSSISKVEGTHAGTSRG